MKTFLVLLLIVTCFSDLIGQNVGIGTTSPKARLQVADSSVVFTANTLLPATAAPTPVSGTGRRMMWYADKAAFRVGAVLFTSTDDNGTDYWDAGNVGKFSFAAGYNTRASGLNGVAMGRLTKADGDNSLATGYFTTASGFTSMATGYGCEAAGWYATATGLRTTAQAYASISVGLFNDPIAGSSLINSVPTDPLFIVGNGSLAETSNAFMILKNGNTGIGINNPTNKLQVAGNTQTASLQVSNGTVFSKMQGGSLAVGSSGTVLKTVTITFPVSFSGNPRVICTIVNDDPLQTNANDTWAVSIRNISATQCVVNVVRVDFSGGWASQPHLSWLAFTN